MRTALLALLLVLLAAFYAAVVYLTFVGPAL